MLFAVEIGFFIIRQSCPNFGEWTMHHDIKTSRRTYLSLAIFLAIIALISLPIFKNVSAPWRFIPTSSRDFPWSRKRSRQSRSSAAMS